MKLLKKYRTTVGSTSYPIPRLCTKSIAQAFYFSEYSNDALNPTHGCKSRPRRRGIPYTNGTSSTVEENQLPDSTQNVDTSPVVVVVEIMGFVLDPRKRSAAFDHVNGDIDQEEYQDPSTTSGSCHLSLRYMLCSAYRNRSLRQEG